MRLVEPATVGASFNRRSLLARCINQKPAFVSEDKSQHCFWMRNTLIPLSIAFLDDDGTVVSIADMAPKSEALTCPQRPVRYALEMDQGWFAKRGVTAGNKISGLPPR